MERRTPGEAPSWGNFHFLFQGLITTTRIHKVTIAIYWKRVLLGLSAILYHVQIQYSAKVQPFPVKLFYKQPPIKG